MLKLFYAFANINISKSPHLFPWDTRSTKIELVMGRPGDSALGLEEARSLLSYRPARGRINQLIIWSLLVKDIDEPHFNPIDFRNSRQGTSIRTGFLLSTASRVRRKRYSCALSTPNALPREGGSATGVFKAYNTKNSRGATITSEGLRGLLGQLCLSLRTVSRKYRLCTNLVFRRTARYVNPLESSTGYDGQCHSY